LKPQWREDAMIDWGRVTELRTEIGAEGFAEVIELFLEEADEAITRLSGPPDPATVEASLHFLKGSALNLGFGNLAALCQDGERKAATGAAVDLAPVTTAYAMSKRLFLSGVGRLSAV